MARTCGRFTSKRYENLSEKLVWPGATLRIAPDQTYFRMVPMIYKAIRTLVLARLLIVRNTFWRGKIIHKIGVGVLVALIAVAAWGLYTFSQFVVEHMRSPWFAELLQEAALADATLNLPTDMTPFLQAVPSVALFGALFLLIFSSFSSVLSALYLSGDLDMLLVTPVPMRAVFIVKFFSGLLPQYGWLLALLWPLLLGYGQGMEYGGWYILVTLLVLLLLPLLPAGLGTLLVMAVVRVIPARRARDVVSVLGGLLGVGVYVVSQFVAEVAPYIANVRNLQTLLQLDLPLLPSAWAGRTLIAAGEGDGLTMLVYGTLFTLLSLITFVGCVLLSERLYYIGWSNMAVQNGRVRVALQPSLTRTRQWHWLWANSWLRCIPRPVRAIFFKDWCVFPRDLRNLQQMIFPLALAGIWTFRLLLGSESAAVLPSDSDVVMLAATVENVSSIGIAFFLCLTLANTIAGAGISREGRTFWLLKLAPISAWHILVGKLCLAYLPFPTVGTLFLVLVAVLRQTSFTAFWLSWTLLLLVGLGSTCITLGLGAVFPRLDWENPQQQITFLAGCLSFLIYTTYILLMLLAVFGLPMLIEMLPGLRLTPVLQVALMVLSWGSALLLTWLAIWGGLSAGKQGIERIEV